MILYRHKNCVDTAVEVLKYQAIEGKDYARIKVRHWNIGPHPWFCMRYETKLRDVTIKGSRSEQEKYPLAKWHNDWVAIKEPMR